MKYEMDLTYDLDDEHDRDLFAALQVLATLNGVNVTVVKRVGPGGGWPVISFEVLTDAGAAWFAKFVEDNGDEDMEFYKV